MVPFDHGKPLVWDATVADTLANSYVSHGSSKYGCAADLAETLKRAKDVNLGEDYIFTPIAFETLGGPGKLTRAFLNDVKKRLKEGTGTSIAGGYFMQQLSLCIQKANASCVLSTVLASTPTADPHLEGPQPM